ncbi:MAG: BglII/BstYI family type II restriction endonuclease, partial [Candidatus Heimdallarchaeaceae archaeon]
IQIIGDFDIHEFRGKKREIKPYFNENLKLNGWEDKVVIDTLENTSLFIPGYIFKRTGLDLVTDHIVKIGTYLLKYELLSNRQLGYIDFGILISYTKNLQKLMDKRYDAKWQGSITYEQIVDYLEVAQRIVSVPLLIIGIDL